MFQLHLLLLLSVVVSALHLQQNQTTFYNATVYLQDLTARQSKFNSDVAAIKVQINDLNKVLNSSTMKLDDQLKAVVEGMADERDKLYNIQTYLNMPFQTQKCTKVNLTDSERSTLQKQIDVVRASLDSLEAQAKACPDCPQINALQEDIKKNYNYLRVIEATVHSQCLLGKYEFVQEMTTGIVNINKAMPKDNLKAKNWVYGNITEQQYKLRMFVLSSQFNLTSCPIKNPYVDRKYKICTDCRGIFKIGEGKCEPCPQNYSYNFQTEKCEFQIVCSAGMVLNKTTLLCEKSTCPQGQAFNTSTNKCQIPSCPTGLFYNFSISRCDAYPSCNSGYYYNTTTNNCELIVCESGKVYDTNSKTCVSLLTNSIGICPPEKPYWNSAFGICEACPAGKVYNAASNSCQ